MKLHVLSDLHLEFGKSFDAPATDADVIVLAGDIHSHTHGLTWAAGQPAFGGKLILYVPGNHEFYNAEYVGLRRELYLKAEALRAEGHAIHVLDADALEIDGTRFLGVVGWTDYLLFGKSVKWQCMREAKRMNDHRLISYVAGRGQLDSYMQRTSLFLPEHAERFHARARAWLTEQLAVPYAGKTVVITHHLPSMQSVAERFRDDLLSAAFASDLDKLVDQADLWCHGHTHDACDYTLGGCRVVCNPRGYPGELGTGFRPDLVVEV